MNFCAKIQIFEIHYKLNFGAKIQTFKTNFRAKIRMRMKNEAKRENPKICLLSFPRWFSVEMTMHFCKKSYFALVIEVVSYEKRSDSHSHLLIGPLHTTIPSIPANSSNLFQIPNINKIVTFHLAWSLLTFSNVS